MDQNDSYVNGYATVRATVMARGPAAIKNYSYGYKNGHLVTG